MVLFLIGYMGCGKTTVGKLLASKLSYTFIDLDIEIEKQTSLPINEIFRLHGEKYFRETEQHILQNLSGSKNLVVATGGGTPCYSNNINFMKTTGEIIYLNCSIKKLTEILSGEKNNRPLIKNKNSEELSTFIKLNFTERETFYNQASIKINTDNKTPKQVVKIIYNHYAKKTES